MKFINKMPLYYLFLQQTLKMVKKSILSIFVAMVILYLSLTDSQSFDKVPFFNIPHFDKIAHFLMYFGLMSVIVFEHTNAINGRTQLSLIALIPFTYGILMEILQLTIAANRSGSIYDVMANSAGIIVSALLWLFLGPRLKTLFK
jgi:VanZ family protein